MAVTREGRRDARRARQREALLDAAERVLRRDGVAGFTVAAVAAEADLSKPALFYWFSGKERLLGELAARLLEAEAAALVAVVGAAPDGFTALGDFVRAAAARGAADLPGWRIVHVWSQVTGPGPDGADLLRDRVYPASARVAGALEARLRAEPALHPDVDPRRLANAAWATANGLVGVQSGLALAGGDLRHPLATLVEEAAAALVRGARA